MASNSISGKTTTTNIIPTKPQIEAVQSVTPFTISTPRTVRQVSLPASLGLFKGSLNVLLYYNNNNNNNNNSTTSDRKSRDSDSGSIHAGWIKESLARALTEQPLLAGRCQRKGSSSQVVGDDHDHEFEVVSNDSGVRLVECRIKGVTLDDLFKSKISMDEAELVFWTDVDEIDPQFSPLFYVQVTKFECGGYSFGISCSIFLADLLLKGNFFKRWAEIHNSLSNNNNNNNNVLEKPLFYLPSLKTEPSPTIGNIFNTTACKNSGQTIIFNVTSTEPSEKYSSDEIRTLALHCVEEADHKVENKSASEFILLSFGSDPENLARIEKLARHGLAVRPSINSANQVKCSSWEDFEGNGLQFRAGNPPIRVSRWIGSVSLLSDHLVVGFPYCCGKEGATGLKFIVRLYN